MQPYPPANVAAVALGKHVFSERSQRLPRHDFAAGAGLQHDFKLLAVHELLHGQSGLQLRWYVCFSKCGTNWLFASVSRLCIAQ